MSKELYILEKPLNNRIYAHGSDQSTGRPQARRLPCKLKWFCPSRDEMYITCGRIRRSVGDCHWRWVDVTDSNDPIRAKIELIVMRIELLEGFSSLAKTFLPD